VKSQGPLGPRAARRLSGPRAALAALAACLFVAAPSPAAAFSPFLVVPEPAVAEQSPAYRYANMTDDEAFAELERRGVAFTREAPIGTVRAPVRLAGTLHGVWFHSSLPEEARAQSMFEILDARLALALDDFAAILERHDIDEVVHYTMYRPNVPKPETEGEAERPARGRAKPVVAGKADKAAPDKAAPAVDKASPDKAAPAAKKTGPDKTPPVADKVSPDKASPVADKTSSVKASPAANKPSPDKDSPPAGKAPAAETRRRPLGKAVAPALPELPKPLEKGSRAGKGKALPAPPGALQKAAAPAAKPREAGGRLTPAAKQVGRRAAPSARMVEAPRAAVREAPARAKPRGTWAPPGTRHPAGLAIDVGLLHRRGGGWLNVSAHFQGHLGAKTCGEGAAVPDSPDARELRALVCEAQDLGVFTYVLTPNFNAAHADHFHMEIKPGVRWFLYH
jgi:hypothetical protein